MRRSIRVPAELVDISLVAAVILASTLSTAGTGADFGGASPLRWALGVVIALPLLGRRRAPEAALVAIAAVAVLQSLLLREMPGFGGFLALLIGAFSVGSHARLEIGVAAMALCLAAVVVVGAVFEPLSVEGVVIPLVYLGAAWAIGRLVGARSARAELLASRAERLVREQAERERAAVADERLRISRELHDVVAHAVTTMVLQAGAAQAELPAGNVSTRARLVAIESSGRQALDELRRVLSVMRDPDANGVQEPMPGIGDLHVLADRISASGVEVGLSVEVERELPPGLSLSVYRIVQEALTNVLRHAGATHAQVGIRERDGSVIVDVSDDGRVTSDSSTSRGSGRGLIGMRERAALFGGSLQAGPGDDGGFRVRARLPVREMSS